MRRWFRVDTSYHNLTKKKKKKKRKNRKQPSAAKNTHTYIHIHTHKIETWVRILKEPYPDEKSIA